MTDHYSTTDARAAQVVVQGRILLMWGWIRSPIALLFVCLFAAWFWWQQRIEAPMRAPRVVAETTDAFMYYYPTFHYAFEQVRQGQLPLWNPYQHCGSPFFATGQHLLLYPLNTLYLLLPTAAAMRATNILHLALAILFTYVLARTFGLGRAAAFTAGAIFTFSPVLTNSIYAPHHLYGAVWMPMQLALTRLVLIRPNKLVPALALAAAVAAQYLGGYPMHCLFSAYLVGSYFLWFAISDWRALSRSAVTALVGAAVLATLFALPQMLPALELARLSPRPLGGLSLKMLDPYYKTGWQLPLQTLTGTFLPTWRSIFASGFAPHVGALGGALAFVGMVFSPRRKAAIYFLIVTVASFALGLGQHTPVYAIYARMPTGDWFRGPNRIFVVTALGAAMLAGLGVDAFARGHIGRRASWGLCGAAVIVAVMLNLAPFLASEQLAAVGRYLQNAVALPGEIPFTTRVAWLSGYAWAAAAWLAICCIWTRATHVLVALLPVAAYASQFVSFINYAPLPDTHPDLHTMPASIVQFLKEHQGYHRTYIVPWGGTFVPSRGLPPPNKAQPPDRPQPVATKSGILHHLYAVDDRENVYPARLTEYAAQMASPEITAQIEQGLAKLGLSSKDVLPQGQFFLRADAPNLRLLDLLGTRFIVDGPQTGFDQSKAPERFPLAFESDGVKVYRNTGELSRAFVVGNAEVIGEPQRVLDRLVSPDFDPMRTVILEDLPSPPPPDAGEVPRFDIQFQRYEAAEVALHVSTSKPGYLVLTDQYYPGWQAEVDGHPAVIYRADYLFRAVSVGAGNHRVVFRYAPRSFSLGLLGAGLGVLLVTLALLPSMRARLSRSDLLLRHGT